MGKKKNDSTRFLITVLGEQKTNDSDIKGSSSDTQFNGVEW